MIYHYKMKQPYASGGGGDGTKSNPWYWYQKTSGTSIQLNNDSVSEDNGRLYIRVKLLAGVTYYIGERFINGGDGRIWLYDQNGNELIDNDDYDGEISGEYVTDHFGYTPSSTGIYIIGAGAYSDSRGDYIVVISQLPESDPVPVSGLIYETSQGFDDFGFPIKYVSAKLADCGFNKYVDNNTVLYIPMYGNNPFSDQSKNSFNITNNGVTSVTDEKLNGKGSGFFNSTYLYSSSNICNDLTVFTFEMSYKLTSIPSGNDWQQGYYFITNGENYSEYGFEMFFGSSNISINLYSYNNRVLTPYTPDTNWHNLKITRDQYNIVKVYQDNILLNSYTDSSTIYSSNKGFAIGRVEPQGEGVSAGFHGYIANYRISDIVREQSSSSSAEQSSSSSQSSHLVFYAPLSSDVNVAYTGQSITKSGNVTYNTIDGIPCAYFDGDSYLYMNNGQNIPKQDEQRTLMAWARLMQGGLEHYVVSIGEHIRGKRYGWGFMGDNKIGRFLYLNTTYYDFAWDYDQWYHMAFTYKNGVQKLYINGQFIQQKNVSSLNTGNLGVVIGDGIDSYDDKFVGYISSVRIYDKELSSDEIVEQFNEFNMSSSSSEASVIYYIVSGAGTDSCNGNYYETQYTSFDGTVVYEKEGGNMYLFRTNQYGWIISDHYDDQWPPKYYNQSSIITDSYSVQDASGPAPSVIQSDSSQQSSSTSAPELAYQVSGAGSTQCDGIYRLISEKSVYGTDVYKHENQNIYLYQNTGGWNDGWFIARDYEDMMPPYYLNGSSDITSSYWAEDASDPAPTVTEIYV